MVLDNFYSQMYGDFQPKNVDLVAGLNTLVAVDSDKQVLVFLFLLSGDTTGNYVLRSGANKLFTFYGLEYFGVPLMSSALRVPIFITNRGELLTLTLPSGAAGSVYLHYRVITVEA